MIHLRGTTHDGVVIEYGIPLTEPIKYLIRDQEVNFAELEIVNIQHCDDDAMKGVLV